MKTLQDIAADLDAGRTRSRDLVEAALAQLADGVAAHAFLTIDAAGARAAADHHDAARKAGHIASAFAGIPFGVKDLFDVADEVTTAGSVVLKDAAPAAVDSDAVARLRGAGFIPLGRTNMTEFAYSGVGLNPHYGTPLSVYRGDGARIPGGSSAGSGVAVGAGVVPVALGTDTGGSCRIPAAFNGIVGLKPSAGAVSRRGVFPLAASLDSVGPLGVSVQCCDAMFRLLADVPVADVAAPARPLRLGLLTTTAMDGLDDVVAADFARACATLRWQGVEITEFACPELAELPGLMANGGLSAFEAYAVHGARLAAAAEAYDPRVASRIALGAKVDVDAVRHFKARRAAIIARFASAAVGFDAVICPTVATIPPLLQDLAGDDDYRRINGLCLRNTALFNFLDGCSISVPMNRAGAAPTGLMLSATGGNDAQLLAVAAEVAGKITPSR